MGVSSFFVLLWQTISDFSFYKRIAGFKFSTVIKYFLTLLLLICLMFSLVTTLRVNKVVKENAVWAVKNLPQIEITNGIVSAQTDMPFKLKKNNFEIIIDTTGQTLSLDESSACGILLTKNTLIYKQSSFQTNSYDLKNIKKFTLNKKTIISWQKNAYKIIFPALLISSSLYYISTKTLQILFFSLFPLMVSRIKKILLTYSQILKISVFAVTVPFIFSSLIELFLFHNKFFSVLFVFIYAFYLIKGILACQE